MRIHLTLFLMAVLMLVSTAKAADHIVLARNGPGGPNFSPSTLTIALGDTVTFKNDPSGVGFHNVVSDSGSATVFRCADGCDGDGAGGDGAASSNAWSATVAFNSVGFTGFHCEIHPVAMTGTIHVLNPGARIALSPNILILSVVEGQSLDSSFSIQNIGSVVNLDWLGSINPQSQVEPCDTAGSVPWLTMDSTSGTAAPGASDVVGVHIDATSQPVGTYNAELCIQSNDPEHIASLPVNVTVTSPDVIFADGFDIGQ